MTKGKRFFIFFSSAGIMTFFLLFTLAVREDNPLKKYFFDKLPNNIVLSMVLEWKNAANEFSPKKIVFFEKAKSGLEKYKLTELEVTHALKEGDVEFMHDLTFPRQKPKQYYILIEINDIEYFTLVHVFKRRSEIIDFDLAIEY